MFVKPTLCQKVKTSKTLKILIVHILECKDFKSECYRRISTLVLVLSDILIRPP